MKVRATWEFEVDVDDLDPAFVDISGLAKDLTKKELEYCLAHSTLTADDFAYDVCDRKGE